MSIHPFPHLARPAAVLLAVSIASTSGCASGPALATHPEPITSTRTATIVIHNRYWGDMALYVVVGGVRYPLGAIGTSKSRIFEVPAAVALPSDISLFATARADGESYQSPSISVRVGDTIIFTLEHQPQFSSLLRR